MGSALAQSYLFMHQSSLLRNSRSLNGSILQRSATHANEWRTTPPSSTSRHATKDQYTRTKNLRSESYFTTPRPKKTSPSSRPPSTNGTKKHGTNLHTRLRGWKSQKQSISLNEARALASHVRNSSISPRDQPQSSTSATCCCAARQKTLRSDIGSNRSDSCAGHRN
jgi:hypothetical protein